MNKLLFPVILAAVLMGIWAVPRPAQAQESNVEPHIGVPGTRFAFFAIGFFDNEYVGYWVNTPAGTVISAPGDAVYANDNGRADWSWTAPLDISPGVYTMVARGGDSGRERLIAFEIVAPSDALPPGADTPPPERVAPSVEPPAGMPGTMFRFSASGFAGDERIGFWINTPRDNIISGEDFFVFATSQGKADWSVRMADDALPGFYSMVARGSESGHEVVIPFAVQ
jgi:hypothetical protein